MGNLKIFFFYGFWLVSSLTTAATTQTVADGIKAYDNANYPEAKRIWANLATAGVVDAQVLLATLYSQGAAGIAVDTSEALKWFNKAAQAGSAAAQFNLAVMYQKGKGVTQDYPLALKLYQLAANQNMMEAQNNLGNLYAKGLGVQKDAALALKWYLKAAEQGHTGAQLNLAQMHLAADDGLMHSEVQAVKWINKAAEGGNKKAQNMLAKAYSEGWLNLPRDPQKAKFWAAQANLP